MYQWKKLLTSLSWNGWPSEGIAPVLKCSQLYLYMDTIFLVFTYNHFTVHKQEIELNWNPKRGVTSVLYLISWSRMYLTDLTCQIKETTEQSGNDLSLHTIVWTFLTHRTRPQIMVDSSLNKVFLLYIALFTSTVISKVLTYLQIVTS